MQVDNIILIVCDALRRGNLGCYGWPFDTSPNIDSFSSKCIVFDNAWTVSNKTDPCFTSIETGLYPATHGIIHHANEIQPDEKEQVQKHTSIAEHLSQQGYRTVGLDFLGRWHRKGFDYYMGIRDAKKARVESIEFFRNLFNINPGTKLQSFLEKTPVYNFFLNLLFSNKETPYSPADELVEGAKEILKVSDSLDQKTFLFIHFWDTHIPYNPPKEFIKQADYSKYLPNTELQISEIRKSISAPLRRFFFDKMTVGKQTANDLICAYDGEIRFVDHNLGELIHSINLNNTMVIITADHGEVMTENPKSYFTHDSFDDCIMNIPLLVYYPGCTPQRVSDKVSIVDIAASIDNNFKCEGRKIW